MSQRQDKYIDQLLRASREWVCSVYREFNGGKAAHIVGEAALGALATARDMVLLDIAIERNVAYVEWDNDECCDYDFGDLSDADRKRLERKLEREVASIECGVLYVRDKSGEWQVEASIGGCWIEGQDDRDSATADYLVGEARDAICDALYCHRDASHSEFSRKWVPGHWTVE